MTSVTEASLRRADGKVSPIESDGHIRPPGAEHTYGTPSHRPSQTAFSSLVLSPSELRPPACEFEAGFQPKPDVYMSPPNVLLRQLHNLDRTSPQFHIHLSNFVRSKEYRNAVQNLQGEDLMWFVEYLDSVSLQTIST